jgi:hypothetical protein
VGKVLKGHGNNSEDSTEGAVYRNAYGTYLHGSLLPKNPHFADYLIGLALQRTYGKGNSLLSLDYFEDNQHNGSIPVMHNNGKKENTEELVRDPLAALIPLDDTLEWQAHASLLERLGLHNAAVAALRHLEPEEVFGVPTGRSL